MLVTRLITGISLTIFVTLIIIYLPIFWLQGAVAALAGVAAFECTRMLLPQGERTAPRLAACLGVLLSAVLLWGGGDPALFLLSLAVSIILTLLFFLRHELNVEQVVLPVSVIAFALLYGSLLFSFLGLVRVFPQGDFWLLLLLGATFAGDTGAYFAGRYLGRHKLAPRLSPGKTWEGFVGGLISSILVAFFVKYLFFNSLSFLDCAVVGLVAGGLGPLGDLSESMLKRSVGVKDSGQLIPGHGGLLDRVDALLFVAPVVYGYVVFVRF